jgi:hypothetical protein
MGMECGFFQEFACKNGQGHPEDALALALALSSLVASMLFGL